MFTLNEIKSAHSKVKSGADFPSYIQEMNLLGVTAYEHFVTDGHTLYRGTNGFKIEAEAKWLPLTIAKLADIEKLQHALTIHQKGETDYLTFCNQAAETGVEKWIVDLQKMNCMYIDKSGNEILTEQIPH